MRHVTDLTYWVLERESIRKVKATGAVPPWTSDPILRDYRFCNVHREDDRVTKWIYNNWLRKGLGSSILPFAACIGRLVNLPETLALLEFPEFGDWDPVKFVEIVAKQKATGAKVWTSAYMVTGGFSEQRGAKEVIIARMLDNLYDKLSANNIKSGRTLEEASRKLVVPGVGPFLAGQIIADLKMRELTLSEASDWDTWCAIGPGSTAGLNYLYDRPQRIVGESQFRKEVNDVRYIIADSTGIHLCAQNTQNVLCEFSKYVRTKYYGGTPKTRYVAYGLGAVSRPGATLPLPSLK